MISAIHVHHFLHRALDVLFNAAIRRDVFERYIGEISKAINAINGTDTKKLYDALLKEARKRTAIAEYPRKGRGGLGVVTHKLTTKTGRVAGGFVGSCVATAGGDVDVHLRLPTPQCAPNFAFLMASVGVPFLSAGQDFLRSKGGVRDTTVLDAIPQGSWAHETIIQPAEGLEFDADFLIQLDDEIGADDTHVTSTNGPFFELTGAR